MQTQDRAVSAVAELSPRPAVSSEEYFQFFAEPENPEPFNPFEMFFSTQHLVLDMQRAMIERMQAYQDFMTWEHSPPRESQTVVLIPGYTANNLSLFELGGFLKAMGHEPKYAISGRNTIQKRTYDEARDSVLRIADKTGEPVTVLGHSAGGLIGAILQSDINESEGTRVIKQVITAGSPVAFPFIPVGDEGNRLVTASAVRTMRSDPEFADMTRLAFTHLPAPREEGEMICAYSKSDPVVNYLYAQRPDATNVEINASHTGFPLNRGFLRHTRSVLAV